MESWDNRLLTNKAREEYESTIELMWKLCPEMMGRKIPEANVQQAFVFDRVLNLHKNGDSILSVGCFEDTAYESLIKSGYFVTGIDPDVNSQSLDDFYKVNIKAFDIVFSTSVLEHVKDDKLFIQEICRLLKPDGYAILTVDYKDDYKYGDPLHATASRFYTNNDLNSRLKNIIEVENCKYINNPDWGGEPDFWYQGHTYSLATMVFRKDSNV